MLLNKWDPYLRLIRLMYKLGVPFEDRMSFEEFLFFEDRIKQKSVYRSESIFHNGELYGNEF